MKLRVLYFARLRERLGCAEETLDCAGSTVADLVAQLQARGGMWAEELAADQAYRVAVNQDIVALDAALSENPNVPFSPPVTGG